MSSTLPEDEIRRIALNGANLVPRQVDDKSNLQPQVTGVYNLFEQVFSTLRSDITTQHRTAACNLLSTLIEKCGQSHEPEFQLLLWQTRSFWRDAFWIYLNQHHALNVKPSRQLLTSLTSVLAKCQDKSICEPEKAGLLKLLVRYITTSSENVPTRPAMQTLAHWLSKKIITVPELCQVLAGAPGVNKPTFSSSSVRDLLDAVLRWAPYEDFASSAGFLAALIIQKAPTAGETPSELTFGLRYGASWSPSISKTLSEKPQSLENLRHYVFPEIFPHDKSAFIAFLEEMGLHEILGESAVSRESFMLPRFQREEVLFCALSVGSKLGIVRVADLDQHADRDSLNLFFDKDVLCIPDILLGNLLLSTSDAVRIAGLAMLTTTTSTTKPLSLGALESLQRGLPLLHADSDAGFRSELFSLIKHLIDRIKAATANLARPATKAKTVKSKSKSSTEVSLNPASSSESIKAHQSFLVWYVTFLKAELRPTASYQRHVSALRCISIIARSGVDLRVPVSLHSKSAGPVVAWPFELDVIDSDMTDLLIDLLLDPFDDVRAAAADILSLIDTASHQDHNAHETPLLVRVLAQAETMMKSSGRADQADGVAHLYGILFSQCPSLTADGAEWWSSQCGVIEHLIHSIEQTLQIATADVGKAVSKHPLHGLFISLRYIIEKAGFYQKMSSTPAALSLLQSFYTRLYRLFRDVWTCVYGTLCNDAPEGFVPDELEEEDIGTKDVLSYSWRALKESSLLLRAIVKSCPLNLSNKSLLSPQQLRDLGDLTFTALAELRHRGAFSTVAQTFVICCVRSNSGAEVVSGTLEDWYKRAILCIQNQTTINTRRSAGLPSLMVGIVVADSKGVLFNQAMQELTAEATRPVEQNAESAGGLSQVHALNCIKDIFKNSKLGERSESHVPEALGLAAKCLSSNTWAVRNSGLMLFRALIDRLIGTNDAYTDDDTPTQSRLSDDAVSSLTQVVLGLLGPTEGDVNQVNTEVVFPALQLLQRVQPPQSVLGQIQQSVLRLASNRQWHVRDKAARTYSILVPANERIARAANLIGQKACSQNEAHGALLGAKYLIERQGKQFTSEEMDTLMDVIQSRIDELLYDNACPFTQAAFVDVQAAFFYAAIQKQRFLFAPGTRWATVEDMEIILDLSQDHFAACSFLRQSLALSLIHEYAVFSGPSNKNASADMGAKIETFVSLGLRDADACATALRQAVSIGAKDAAYASQTTELLAKISARLLFDEKIVDIELQDAAQEVLTHLFAHGAVDAVRDAVLGDMKTSSLPTNTATPLFSDKRLILQGALLNLRAEGGSSIVNDFEQWVPRVHSALHEANPFDTRFAAASATSQLNDQALTDLKSADSSSHSSSFLDFCLAVYDLNNDDDDEIRTLAAPVATRILSAGDKQLTDVVPLAASSRLADFIASQFRNHKHAASAAVSRMTGSSVTVSTVKPVKEILADKSKQDMSLFVQEKQNLFIDETRKAKTWSTVAAKMQAEAFSEGLVRNLSAWVMDGLDVLTSEIGAHPDTPLGWSRKSEVFVLGLQVVHSAELLLSLHSKLNGPVFSDKQIKDGLKELLTKGKENGANVLWLQAIRDILQKQG